MRKIVIMAMIGAMALCGSCRRADDDGGSEATKNAGSATHEVIEKHIKEMGQRRWDKAAYLSIRDKEIAEYAKKGTSASSLIESLDATYVDVLVNEINMILKECDASEHSKLKSAVAELEQVKGKSQKKAAINDALGRYQGHQAVMNFISGLYAKQTVKDINTPYDEKFETTKKAEAKKYQDQNLRCKYQTKMLQPASIDKIFKDRRKAYADALMELYCKGETYDSKVENNVMRLVTKAVGSTAAYDDRLDEFRDTHKKDNTTSNKPN